MITEKPFSRNPIKIIFFSSSRTKDNFSFSILVVLFLILRICLNKVIACGNPKTSRIYVLTIANLAFVESLFLLPSLDRHPLVSDFRSFVFHFVSLFTSRIHQSRPVTRDVVLYCFVFLPTQPPTLGDFALCHRVVERFIGHIIECCLLFVRILNKLLCVPKSELLFICIRGVVGEFEVIFMSVDDLVGSEFLCIHGYEEI